MVVERFTAASHASGRAEGLFKSVQADELRTRLTQRSIEKAVSFADWAGVPLQVARSGELDQNPGRLGGQELPPRG